MIYNIRNCSCYPTIAHTSSTKYFTLYSPIYDQYPTNNMYQYPTNEKVQDIPISKSGHEHPVIQTYYGKIFDTDNFNGNYIDNTIKLKDHQHSPGHSHMNKSEKHNNKYKKDSCKNCSSDI